MLKFFTKYITLCTENIKIVGSLILIFGWLGNSIDFFCSLKNLIGRFALLLDFSPYSEGLNLNLNSPFCILYFKLNVFYDFSHEIITYPAEHW